MATGDITRKWGTETEVAWATGGPDSGIADGAFSGASDELVLSTLAPVEDLLLGMKITASAAPAADGYVQLWAITPVNGNYVADSDNYVPVGRPMIIDSTSAEYSPLASLAEAFGGALPQKVKLLVENQAGVALSSVANSCEVYRQTTYSNVSA